jgi:hypothetical protein
VYQLAVVFGTFGRNHHQYPSVRLNFRKPHQCYRYR